MDILSPPPVSAANFNAYTAAQEYPLRYDTVAGAYPARPSSATAPFVLWIGPVAPTIGGAGNAIDGDFWRKTP